MRFLKYFFSIIYVFYRDVLGFKESAHHNATVVASILLVSNIYVLTNTISLVYWKEVILPYPSNQFIAVGLAVMFIFWYVIGYRRRYFLIVEEVQNFSNEEKMSLKTGAVFYFLATILSVILFLIWRYLNK